MCIGVEIIKRTIKQKASDILKKNLYLQEKLLVIVHSTTLRSHRGEVTETHVKDFEVIKAFPCYSHTS